MSELLEGLGLLAEGGPDFWEQAWIATPRLLSAGLHDALASELASADPSVAAPRRPVLEYLVRRRLELDGNLARYPFGNGPLERLLGTVLTGDTTLESASQLAGEPAVVGVVGDLYLRALDVLVDQWSGGEAWLEGGFLQALVLSAAEALPPVPGAAAALTRAVLRMCATTQRALIEAPDAFLFTRARDAAMNLLASLSPDPERADLIGTLHHRLGTLHLDPYSVGRPSNGYAAAIDVWSRRTLPGRSAGPGPSLGITARGLPSPRDALRIASEHLERAATLRTGTQLGLTHKALLFALALRKAVVADGEVTSDLCALAGRALRELPRDARFLRDRLAVEHLARGLGCGSSGALDDYEDLAGGLATMPLILALEVATILSADHGRSPEDRLAWLDRLTGRVDSMSDGTRVELAHRTLRLLIECRLPGSDQPPDIAALQHALSQWQSMLPDCDPETGALRAFQLACACDSMSFERPVPALLDIAYQVAPGLMQSRWAFGVLRAALLDNAAAAALARGERSAAAELSLISAARYDASGLAGSAVRALERSAAAVAGDLLAGAMAFSSVAGALPGMELRLGSGATTALQAMLRETLEAMLVNGDAAGSTPLLHALKGARFASALLAREGMPSIDVDALAAIDELEASLPVDVVRSLYCDDPRRSEALLLSSPLDGEIRRDGTTDATRLANLQVRFDRAQNQRALRNAPLSASYVLDDDARRQKLDERTVLVDLFWDRRRGAMYTWLSTRERTLAGVYRDAAAAGGIATDRDIDVERIGMLVAGVRERVDLDADLRPVDAEAAAGLARLRAYCFESIAEPLAELRRQGKDHLAIVPHGALHYAPLHLAHTAGRVLADDWIVTYLPSLHVLGPARVARRGPPIAAFGVTFAGTQAALPQAVTEVGAIASVFGAKAMLDRDAHRDAVLEGFATARYLHLCTHGRHNVVAPWFQLLLCGGGTALRAHELLGRDLRGLEVVTLAACETGLGRFDGGDNLAGLPAALFMGGVESIVGTLWNVDSATAEVFFTWFYQALRSGRSRLDAFAAAQGAAREFSPRQRHWGAFFLSGAWS